MKKIFFSILALLILFPTYSTFAQSGLGTKIASVNIQQVQVRQTGNDYTVSFTLTNGIGIQTGLRYSIQLLQQQGDKQYLVDEKVYDETLTLRENSSVKKEVTYVPPSTISGSYKMAVAVYNDSGFPFAVALTDNIAITGGSGLVVYPETCTIQAGATKSDITKSVTLSPNAKLTVSCSVKNNSAAAVTAQPVLETKIGSLFGAEAQVGTTDLTPLSFSSGEQKTVSIVLPKAAVSQTYVAKLMIGGRQEESNPVFVRYTIYGAAATIQNISFDKDSYNAKDTANLSLFWTGSVSKAHLTVSVANMVGASCADSVEQVITTKPTVQIPIAMTKACKNPKVTAVLKDDAGTVLDQKDFAIQSAHTPIKLPWAAVAAIIIGLIGVGMYMKKKKSQITAPIAVVLLGALLSLVSSGTVHADNYSSGPNGEIVSVVTTPNGRQYNPDSPIAVTAQIFNYSASTAFPVSLSVINNNGGTVNLIPATTIVNPGQNTAIFSYTFANPNGAPSVAGTYPIKFTTGVDVATSAVFSGGGPSSAPVQGGTNDTNVYCDASISQAVSSDSIINFQYKTQLSTTQWDPCTVVIPAGQTNGSNYPGREYFGASSMSVQVTDFCFDAGSSSVPNGPSSGAPSC